jgi:hypothetical protein
MIVVAESDRDRGGMETSVRAVEVVAVEIVECSFNELEVEKVDGDMLVREIEILNSYK